MHRIMITKKFVDMYNLPVRINKKNMNIKLIITFYISLTLLLSACNHLSENSDRNAKAISKPGNIVQLNVIGHWLNEGKREKLMREFINEFEFSNQEINVNLKFPEELYQGDNGEIDFIINQITKPVSDYDVLRLKSHYSNIATKLHDQNWGTKYLVDFSTIPGYKENHLASFDLEAIKRNTGNVCTSPYMEGTYNAVFTNLEVAKKIGITVKQYGMTYEDFLGYIKAVDAYNKTNKTSIMAIFENADNGWITSESLFMRLYFSLLDGFSEISDTRFTEKKLTALAQTYKAYEELSKYHPIRSNSYRSNIDWGRDNDYPLKDSCLFFVNGSYMYNIWDGKNHKALSKILPCELPVFKFSDTYVGNFTSNWCVPKNAPHREAAIKLMMYWCQPAMAEKWVRYTKCPTGIKGNLTEITFGIDPFEDFQYQINKKYGKNLVASFDYYLVTGKNSILLKSEQVLAGEMTAAEAMKRIRKDQKIN